MDNNDLFARYRHVENFYERKDMIRNRGFRAFQALWQNESGDTVPCAMLAIGFAICRCDCVAGAAPDLAETCELFAGGARRTCPSTSGASRYDRPSAPSGPTSSTSTRSRCPDSG